MKIVINPAYETLREYVERLPDTFGEGKQLYAARNTLNRFRWQGVQSARFREPYCLPFLS